MRKLNLLLCTAIFSFLFCFSYGQKGNVNLNDSLKVDPNVVIGKLDNGITYYIRKNAKPEKRVELRLAVNAGSIMENESQKGLAHFTEHMCFNGTKNFPHNELVDFLQKTGVKFGADINAYTSFDETVYMLQVPTDNKELIEKGMQVIEDWAHQVTFDGKEIDKERGVITEEWRLGLGADDRMRKKYFPVIFKDSRYAERLPIGDINVIKNFAHDTIRKFYSDWYRPDLQAVAVVGDIDVKEMEAMIKQHFGSIPKPVNPRQRTIFDIPDNKEPLISIVTDKEATSSAVMLFYKHDSKENVTVGDYKQYLTATLYTEMLNARLNEITLKADAPFIMAQTDYGSFLARTKDAYELFAVSKENQIEKSLQTLLIENQRVKQFGFTETEMERIKDQLLSDYEKAAKEFDKTESGRLVGEYVSNFLSKDPIPGAQAEFKLVKKLLPEIKLEDVNALASKWITDNNMIIVATAPEKEGITVPTEKQLLNVIAESKKAVVTAYVDKFKAEPLVKDELKGTNVTSKKENKELGYTELTFGNGVTAIIKKTDFKNDEILVKAYSTGGTSLYSDNDYASAYFASSIIDQCGIGNFSNTELEKKLKGKDISLSPYIDDIKQGLSGKCGPKDFETLLQLTYLYCKAPRKDTAEYNAFMSKMKTQLKFLGSNPIYAFYDTLFKAATSNSPRVIVIPKEKQLNQVDLDLAYKIYSERFANANNMKFFIVGNIDVDSITPMLEKYLGGLPGTGKEEVWQNKNPKFPVGVTDFVINKGTEQKSMVGIMQNEKFDWNDKNRICLAMIKEIMSIKLIEVIREKMSGVYSPQIQLSADQYPESEYSLMIMFGCSPSSADKLTKAVFKIMKSIRDKGPEEIDLSKTKETLIRGREVDVKTNKFWLDRLESYYFNKDDAELITDYTNKVNAITLKDIQECFSKYFPKDNYVRVVLKPEEKK
ncbi:MAG TPA: insulinase family protein [Bacteroidales bacterium]|nr:insulinase family protein [Bacteroidales bacterium]HPS17984.1 insulinase family protein [Bacteroidales bacterium]